jgi:hypothetical protein
MLATLPMAEHIEGLTRKLNVAVANGGGAAIG